MNTYGGYVDPVYLEASARVVGDLKQRSFEAMELGPNDRVLDVGSGSGIDTTHLGDVVTVNGVVIGVDADPAMVDAANSRVDRDGCDALVVHIRADASALPFGDDSFDGVRSERVLQHIDDPAVVVAEMARVVRPGGVVVAVDTDWATLSMDSSDIDVERRLVRYKSEQLTRNGTAGRQLFRHFRAVGLDEVNVVPFALTASFDLFRIVSMWDDLIVGAVRDGALTAPEAEAIEAELAERDRLGCGFGSLNLNLATGRKRRATTVDA